MYTRNRKGQATIEYLVLLAVAIIVALVIFAFVGFVPGLAGSLKERQSRLFYASTFPIQIRDYKITPAGATLQLQNVGETKIEIKNFTAGGLDDTTLDLTGTAARLGGGETKIFTANAVTCATVGDVFDLENVSIGYDVISGISAQIQRTERPLVGKCTS